MDAKWKGGGVHQDETAAVRGPYFDELAVGRVFESAPAVTLTEGLQASHAAAVGNRVRLALDHELARMVAGGLWRALLSCGTPRSGSPPW